MSHSRHSKSPNVQPRSLRPPSWTSTPARPHYSTDSDTHDARLTTSIIFPRLLKQPFNDPHEVLCREFNVAKTTVSLGPDGSIPKTIDMPVLRDAHMPTHTLIVIDSHHHHTAPDRPPAPSPLAVPINADTFAAHFSSDVGRHSADLSVPGSTLPVPYWDERTRAQNVTMPTIPLRVPHPPSVPLLLLYGLGVHQHADEHASSGRRGSSRRRSGSPRPSATTNTGSLATYLLPTYVIEEFPAAAAMAEVMARHCSDAEMQQRVLFNQGLWANVLALGPLDTSIVDLVHKAWNVTAEARRIRERRRAAAAPALASVPKPKRDTDTD